MIMLLLVIGLGTFFAWAGIRLTKPESLFGKVTAGFLGVGLGIVILSSLVG
jgi:hypothetical protein